MNEIFGKSGWANPPAVASEAGPDSQEATASENVSTRGGNSTKNPKKRKRETIMDTFISEMQEERVEKERRREAKAAWFEDLKTQRERHHQEKLQMMQQLFENMIKK